MANNPIGKARELQRALYRAAKRSTTRRFHALYDKVYRKDILWAAWEKVKANRGGAGVDGETIEAIKERSRSVHQPAAGGAEGGQISASTGEAGEHPEAGWETTTSGHSCGTRSSSAGGGEDRRRADLRSGFQAL